MPYEEGTAVLRNTRGKTMARRLTVTAIALMIPVLAGCEAGADAPTLSFHPAASGAYATVGDLRVNNVFVLGPPTGSTLPVSGSAGLFLGVFNGGAQADRLTEVDAPGTASVTIKNGGVVVPAGGSALLTGPEPQAVLTGLTRSLRAGQTIAITLKFARSGQVNLQVPVEPYNFYYTMYSTAPVPTPSTSVTASPGASPSPGATPSASSTPKK